MTKDGTRLSGKTIAQLVEQFAEIAVDQSRAIDLAEYGKYNRLFEKMNAVENELIGKGEAARLALLRLFDHPNRQVRVAAAKATLVVAPIAARNALESIVAEKWFPQALDAGMTLTNLDNGTFKPT